MITKSKIQLWVDGQPCNIHSVWIHFQRDPYSGGQLFKEQKGVHDWNSFVDDQEPA